MTKTEEPSCNLSRPAGRNCHRSDKPNEIVKTRTIKRRTMLWRKRFMPTFSAIIYTDSTFKLWQSIIQTHSAHDQYFTHGSLISVNHLFFQLQSSAVKIYTLLQKKTLTIPIEIFFCFFFLLQYTLHCIRRTLTNFPLLISTHNKEKHWSEATNICTLTCQCSNILELFSCN